MKCTDLPMRTAAEVGRHSCTGKTNVGERRAASRCTRALDPKELVAVALLSAAVTAFGGPGANAADNENCGFAFAFEHPVAGSTAEQTIMKGLKRAESDLHVKIDIIDGTELAGLADNLRAAAAKGCYQAIGTAFFETGDILGQVAKDFPQQQFYIEGGFASGANITSYSQANEQGTYVAGAMAATLSGGSTIGIIIGNDSPPLVAFSAGYTAGAHSVDPSVKVLVNAVGSFTDAAKTGAIAITQASQGAKIIYPAAGSNLQVYFLGEKRGYKTIASDLVDYANAKGRNPALAFIAASAEDQTNYDILQQYVGGGQKQASKVLGLKDRVFTIPYVTDDGSPDYALPAEAVAAGKKAYDEVVSGKVIVPNK